jgi:uncharacterized membrane protein YgcG
MIYLQLIRYKNLLLLALMQIIFRYGFLKQQDGYLSLADWQYFLLGTAALTPALLPMVRRHNSGSDSSSSDSSSSDSSGCGGSSCSSCGGCGGD